MVNWWKIFMKPSGMKQNVFLKSLNQAKEKDQLGISQRQAVIKLLEKKGREKEYIKNWRPISPLNVYTKLYQKLSPQS